jgi:hypothetical protein
MGHGRRPLLRPQRLDVYLMGRSALPAPLA